MTNHMAQGAATSMEDGAFLARCLKLVIDGRASVREAVRLYERERMPRASYKQQLSFLNGWIWHIPDGAAQEARDAAMRSELEGEVPSRSPNLYGDPMAVQQCYGYDAETHADEAIAAWLGGQGMSKVAATTPPRDVLVEQTVNWFLPRGHGFALEHKL